MASQWGRIDDDGTVYVRTADGERAIGSWQAGDPAEGLAYYERRYADLATEIDLLRRRLDSGAGEAKATWNQAATLQDTRGEVPAFGVRGPRSPALAELRTAAEAKRAEQLRARAEARLAAVTA